MHAIVWKHSSGLTVPPSQGAPGILLLSQDALGQKDPVANTSGECCHTRLPALEMHVLVFVEEAVQEESCGVCSNSEFTMFDSDHLLPFLPRNMC